MQPAATQLATTIAPTQPPTATPAPTPTPLPLAHADFLTKGEASVRLVSFNINWDSIFPFNDPESHDLRFFDRSESFVRIMQALAPDILCLQEINPERDADAVAAYLDAAIDAEGDQVWSVVLVRDTLIASRFALDATGYEMAGSSNIPGLEQAAAVVNLPNELFDSTDLYLICSHFKSGSNIADERMRQRQADALMGHLRDTTGGLLPYGTGIVLAGDFNLYDLAEPAFLPTLLEGDLEGEAIYGPDFTPDWDATALTDLLPTHNGLGLDVYTWRDDGEPFEPGALDHIIYSDSVLAAVNLFVLNTTQMAPAALEAAGLHENDVLLDVARLNFDHLPLVMDFVLTTSE
jgi:endonuclease/exonuclease/phosphatase family metal-dependent hydrolase